MAIDDNASYELTGYQVKDLASKIRAKADSNSLASVATSGLYSDLTGAPTIPTVYNGTLTIQQNGTTLGTFSANQDTNETINITGGGGASVTTVVLTLDTPSAGDFSTDKTFAQIISADIVQIFEGTYIYSVMGSSDATQKSLYISADGTSIYKLDYTSSSATSGTYTKFESQEKLSAGTNISIAADGKTISATDTTYSAMTGATSQDVGTSGLVPAPAAGDQGKALKGDGTWGDVSEKFVIMKYGEANAWAKFLAAYQSNAIVYCRASSNANPGTGSQTRLAFMAYVSNETTPTSVEFQYVRSVGTKTVTQPVDQVFVYKLTSANGGTWSVETRDMAPKVEAGTGINVSYSNGTYTISLA